MVSPMATYPPLSLRDISPKGEHPSVKTYGLPAPLSGEPVIITLQIKQVCLPKASPERRGGPLLGSGEVLDKSPNGDTLTPHS